MGTRANRVQSNWINSLFYHQVSLTDQDVCQKEFAHLTYDFEVRGHHQPLKLKKKVYEFYTAPITKFWADSVRIWKLPIFFSRCHSSNYSAWLPKIDCLYGVPDDVFIYGFGEDATHTKLARILFDSLHYHIGLRKSSRDHIFRASCHRVSINILCDIHSTSHLNY